MRDLAWLDRLHGLLVLGAGLTGGGLGGAGAWQAMVRGDPVLAAGLAAVAAGIAVLSIGLLRYLRRLDALGRELAAARRQVAEADQSRAAALANIAQGICLFDAEHRLVLANRRYLELYDLPAEHVRPGIGLRQVMELSAAAGNYPAERAGAVIEERLAIAAAAERRSFVQTLASGRSIEVIHQPLPSGGFVATYADMSDRQRAMRELIAAKEAAEAASRTKSQFLATMSHELRTPLNAIIGFSEMIATETYGPVGSARYLEYARDIRRSGVHLLDLINGILDTAKIEAGRYTLQEEEVMVAAIVEICLAMVRPNAEAAAVKIVAALDRELPAIRVDRRAVVQVLLNLLSNAVKFTPAGGSVTVGAALGPAGALSLQVADTGIGIASDLRDKLFEPFVQGDPTVSRRHPGSGLGLSISRGLMQLHGGTLSLDSTPGRGTVATARFPAARVAPRLAPVKT